MQWRNTLAKDRAVILRRWYELMIENQKDLAVLMTMEQGKPLAEAMGEVVYSASFIEWFSHEARRIAGETIPQHQLDKRLVVIKQPIGVCVAITPWNFPSAMIHSYPFGRMVDSLVWDTHWTGDSRFDCGKTSGVITKFKIFTSHRVWGNNWKNWLLCYRRAEVVVFP